MSQLVEMGNNFFVSSGSPVDDIILSTLKVDLSLMTHMPVSFRNTPDAPGIILRHFSTLCFT